MKSPVLPGLFMVQIQELTEPEFDGATYQQELDQRRLTNQLFRVTKCLENGRWWTLEELAIGTGDPQASISARIRDLRKPRFGGREVEHRRRHGAGLWEYRLKEQ